jgi:hypothetical protein
VLIVFKSPCLPQSLPVSIVASRDLKYAACARPVPGFMGAALNPQLQSHTLSHAATGR